jgi:hypothetical protein
MGQIFVILAVAFSGSFCWGINFLHFTDQYVFNSEQVPRLGIEIEFSGLSQMTTAQVLAHSLGGEIQSIVNSDYSYEPHTGQRQTYATQELHILNSRIGKIIVKPEDNGVDDASLEEKLLASQVLEIVTEPIDYNEIQLLQKALDLLKLLGATGTSEHNPVAIQVNMEIGRGQREAISSHDIISILRTYFLPNHYLDIIEELQPAPQRQEYLGLFTPMMMQRLWDPDYRPNNYGFYLDFMYRQSLELLGQPQAWNWSEERVRGELPKLLRQRSFQKLLPIMKFNDIRVSAVLMFLYPDDWLSQYLKSTGWFHQYPVLEFRAANSDFQLLKRVRQFVGLTQYSEFSPTAPMARRTESLRCSLIF